MGSRSVCMIGLGYIGLPTAAVLASRGVNVVGVDINPRAVEAISRGTVHIVEPGLDIAVKGAVATGKLRATFKPEPADTFIVAVPTPFTDNHKPDLSYIQSASQALATVVKKGDLVVLESTSPVGTTERMCAWIAEQRPDLKMPEYNGEPGDIFVAHCPERVLPGQVLRELVENDRIIGGMTRACAERAKELYEIFVAGECVVTDARTAEMCKLTENSFRDVNIAFANELSMLCERFEVNVWELIAMANRHPRVKILKPGPGVGGHCIAVDPWFIVDSAPDIARLIRTARTVNDDKARHVYDLIAKACAGKRRPRIACFGLAFKANIDDLRESPAVEIVQWLADNREYEVLAVEPHISELPKVLADHPNVKLTTAASALEEAEVLVLLVDHNQFKGIDKNAIHGRPVVDTRGAWR